MTDAIEISFASLTTPLESVAAVLAGNDLVLGPSARELDNRCGGAILKAAEAAQFKGKSKSSFELLAQPRLEVSRLVVVGAGTIGDLTDNDWIMLGGSIAGQIAARKTASASLLADAALDTEKEASEAAADLAMGALLRLYKFSKYQTRKAEEGESSNGNSAGAKADGLQRLVVHCANPEAARAAFQRRKAVANGMMLARDLVNEPANELGPVEFAERARALERHGVEVEVLDVAALEALNMKALLGVGQGSVRPSRVVVMQWHGTKSKRPKQMLCFVGKGVVFDTGGISMKPAAGMEDMKGDMGGAACVTGLMQALAERKAPVNAVGIIGLVENMPSGNAQRPGDIVRSASGQTVEVLNTDAEGRLVLADVLWYAQDRFKGKLKLIVDLATLTGAIMVALGKEYAGLFANDDKLAADLAAAGEETGEKVWRMPLHKAYDKMIDSKNADMKNIGGRFAGAITAAQFLQRFVDKGTPWAHLDVAGVAMDSNKTDISQGWASGWGVRLLDKMVADKHER